MYDVSFVADGDVLRMCFATGIHVKTISGLTGVTSTFTTVQNASGAGVSVSAFQTGSKAVSIKGVVLDGETATKQSILSFFRPGRKLVMYINSQQTTSDVMSIFQARVVVKASPVFTQTKHSPFSIELLMPMPYWESTQTRVVPFNTAYVVEGDADPEFDLTFKLGQDDMTLVSLRAVNSVSSAVKSFGIALVSPGISPAEQGDVVHVWRDDGVIKASLNGVERMSMLFAESDLWYLPLGTWTFGLVALGGSVTDAMLTYRPVYSGVLVDGV